MRKILTAGAAAIACLASLVATTTPASAEPHGGWHGGGGGWHGGGWRGDHDWHGGGRWGWGVGAGLAGFALGAAIAHPYYDGYYYGPGYYDGYYPYGECVGTRRVWDPYYGGYVIRRFYYAC